MADDITFNITDHCRLTGDFVHVGSGLQERRGEVTAENWLAHLYRKNKIDYPKFFKMDALCKAGFIAAELLLASHSFDRENVKENWGVRLLNSSSSLHNDTQYNATICKSDNYFPSPALFVYTLANIVTGEICIRHKIGGESSFFIYEKFMPEELVTLTQHAFQSTPSLQVLLCGWMEYGLNNQSDVLLLMAERSETAIKKDIILQKINTLY